MMKKTLLLASAACLFSFGANAMDLSAEMKPYVGLDYAYSHGDIKKDAGIKKDYNSGIINAGVKMGDYSGLEAFFQQSGERKAHHGERGKVKSEFYAYGLDAYGYMPMGCEKKFNLLGSLGLANYNMKVKVPGGNRDKQKVGYRVGIGASYDLTENWSARIMGRYSYIGAHDIKSLQEVTAGVRYTF